MRISDWSSDVCSSDLVAVDAPGATVHAGRVRLEQVLINLLQNAAEAMQGSPDARIILSNHGDTQLHIDVCDKGHGVPEALKPKLLTTFTPGRAAGRQEERRVGKEGGSGGRTWGSGELKNKK